LTACLVAFQVTLADSRGVVKGVWFLGEGEEAHLMGYLQEGKVQVKRRGIPFLEGLSVGKKRINLLLSLQMKGYQDHPWTPKGGRTSLIEPVIRRTKTSLQG